MEPEYFDAEPLDEEQMRLENEIMKLRLQAEYGSIFPDADTAESDPGPEYAFLKRVLQLHRRIAGTKPRPLREVLSFDQFIPADEFGNEHELSIALREALEYLEDANVIVDFDHDYPDRVMYDFITRELPELEVIGAPADDEYLCVVYEAFHPNPRADIEDFTDDLFSALFCGDISGYLAIYFRSHRLPPRLTAGTEQELSEVIKRFHECFECISHWQVRVDDIEPDPGAALFVPGSGTCVRGTIEYTAALSDGSQQVITGPFRLDLLQEDGFWYASDFELRGFIW